MNWLSDCGEQRVRKRKKNMAVQNMTGCIRLVLRVAIVAGGSESLSGHHFSSKELLSNV